MPAAADQIELLTQDALAHYETGRLDEAEALLSDALTAAPDDATVRYLLGCIAADRGEHAAAAHHLRAAVEAQPDFVQALALLGDTFMMLGAWQEAASTLRRLTELRPDLVESWNSLAIALHGLGEFESAAREFGRVLALEPNHASARLGLGETLFLLCRDAEAADVLCALVAGGPDCEEACVYLALSRIALGEVRSAVQELRHGGNYTTADLLTYAQNGEAATAVGKPEAALAWFARAAACDPEEPNALSALGLVFARLGRSEVAEACFRHAATLAPNRTDILSNLGAVLTRQNRGNEALSVLTRAVKLDRGDTAAWRNLAAAAICAGDFEETARASRALSMLEPIDAVAAHDLGYALYNLGDYEAACVEFHRALRLRPGYGAAYAALACAYRSMGSFEEAIVYSLKAVEADPTPRARQNLGVEQLRAGRYREGWANFEYRESPPMLVEGVAVPKWDGDSLDDRTLLVIAEGGLGDTIQHARFLPLAAERRKGPIIFACQPGLTELLADMPGDVKVISRPTDSSPPSESFDRWVSLLSLPALLGTREDTIPTPTLPVRVSAEAMVAWSERLGAMRGFKVGLCWTGNPAYPDDRYRSMRLEDFAPLAAIEGLQLVSLQIGTPADEVGTERHGLDILHVPDGLTPLPKTAALLRQLDLVISVDTSIAHLAGVLDVETWLLLPFVPGFWLNVNRPNDTPWYPRHRLFRQPRQGDWQSVVDRVSRELHARVAGVTDAASRDDTPGRNGSSSNRLL